MKFDIVIQFEISLRKNNHFKRIQHSIAREFTFLTEMRPEGMPFNQINAAMMLPSKTSISPIQNNVSLFMVNFYILWCF